MGTIFGHFSILAESNFSPQTGHFLIPTFADFLVVPSAGITGEIETPHGIHDWNSIISSQGNWALIGVLEAPEGSVSIYRNTLGIKEKDFSSAPEWIKSCDEARSLL